MWIAKNEDLIILANENREELEQQLQFMVYTSIEETDVNYILYNGEYLTEEEISAKERQRLDMLTLTPADVERALYQAKGMDFDDLLNCLEENKPDNLDMKALKIEFKANNFYRGNPYIVLLGEFLGYSEDDLDYLFKTGSFPEIIREDTLKNEL